MDSKFIIVLGFYLSLVLVDCNDSSAQSFDFRDTTKWVITDPQAVHTVVGGRQSLFMPSFNGATLAYLKDFPFHNGIIEVDMMFLGHRSYNGLAIRLASEKEYEYFYLRPQASGKMEALQYAPVFKGKGSWQLCSGEGYNSATEIPTFKWVHIKIVVRDTQAEVYYDDSKEAVLRVYELKRGNVEGTVGLVALNGGAFFSNFKVTRIEDPGFLPISLPQLEPGVIKDWMITQNFSYDKASITASPKSQKLQTIWNKASADLDGTIDILKMTPEDDHAKKIIFAKVIINSEKAQSRKLSIGFSDNIAVSLNNSLKYEGRLSHNRYEMTLFRDKEEGIILNLNKGRNELVIGLSELQAGFGGWGFQAALDNMDGITFEL